MTTETQETSRLAWDELAVKLGKRQAEVLSWLKASGDTTARELEAAMSKAGVAGAFDAHKRIAELAKAGLVKRTNTRRCSITGKLVSSWSVR